MALCKRWLTGLIHSFWPSVTCFSEGRSVGEVGDRAGIQESGIRNQELVLEFKLMLPASEARSNFSKIGVGAVAGCRYDRHDIRWLEDAAEEEGRKEPQTVSYSVFSLSLPSCGEKCIDRKKKI